MASTNDILLFFYFYIIVAEGAVDLDQKSKVISVQDSLVKNTQSYAIWNGAVGEDLQEALTICYRVKIYYYRPEVTAFSYIDSLKNKIRTDHNRIGMQVLMSGHNFRVDTGIITPLMHWSAFCIGFHKADAKFVLYYNGDKWESREPSVDDGDPEDEVVFIENNGFQPNDQSLMNADGTVVLGQDQDAPKSEFDPTQSLSGALTDVNIWSRLLTHEEMVGISTCQMRLDGDILAWDTAEWTLGSDSSMTEELLKDTCNIKPAPYFMFPDKLKNSDAIGLCQAFGGKLATPRSQEEQQVIYKLAESNSHLCAKDGGALMWLGITDKYEEGAWQYIDDKSNVTYFNWIPGQPNGKMIENCAVIKGKSFEGAWADQQCRKSFKVCALCSLDLPVFIRFRGICDATLYDDRFVMAGMKNKKPYFRGYYRSQLYFTDSGVWRLENILVDNTYATKEDDGSLGFPIGRHLWKFSHGFCGKEKGDDHSLAFTQCAKNEEFTCNDGTCIPINQVCDRREQCPDLSDELDCSTVLLPPGYQTTLPPPSENLSGPLPVYLNLTLNSFESIDAINNRFRVELVVRMIWKDLRLQFKHLRRDRQLNIILPSEADDIWVPIVGFLNAEDNQHTKVDDYCKITIKRLGPPLGDNIEYSKEARIYEGNENYIRIVRKYFITFRCNFNFFYFPFTTDYCNMIFRISKNTENYVSLETYGPGIRYKRQDKLTEYEIGGVYMEKFKTDEPYSGLQTVIQMKHLYISQVVTIFVPTTLINFISFATFFFKWFDFQNRIMVSLTALLVLCTLFAQISDSLPKTSYFKLIDIWFFASILFAFITIMIHTIVEFNHHYDSSTQNNHSSIMPPTFSPSVKVLPVSEVGSAKSSFQSPVKMKHPFQRAVRIHKIGNVVTLSMYGLFFIVFWIVAFTQKIAEDSKTFPVDDDVVTGYPE